MSKLVWVFAAVLLIGIAGKAVAETPTLAIGKQPTPEQIAALRERGPDGLAEALRIYDGLQLEQRQSMLSCVAPPAPSSTSAGDLDAWSAAIDQIGGQRGCTVSRIYWYTNLAKAKAEAERTGRPILSLRMLGKLTDEFSCANSRFFRTALYANKDIREFLRVNYILHWQSVRPVPRVTIDFGDGRKLERTLTGNSAHYVLASDGTPLDVLPGLYSPVTFHQWLWDLRNLQLTSAKVSASERAAKLQEFHRQARDESIRRWDADIQRIGEARTELFGTRITGALASARLAGQKAPADPA